MKKNEFKVTYTRGTGAGGQHKNKVETCCIVTHIPTGISERCQDSRSKSTNYDTAMKRVLARIEKLKVQEKKDKLNQKRKQALTVGVIKTYNFQRGEVKDHRTGEISSLADRLNGKF